jgi:MIP family channel proteins
MNARVYLAELLGTFLFMMVGYTSFGAIGLAAPPTTGLVVVPFAFGLGLAAAIFAFGHISGGHFNPAVTLGIVLDGRLPAVEGAGYVIAQIIGAIGAAAVIYASLGQSTVAAGITKPGAGVSDASALLLETIFTAIFVVVILVSSKRAPQIAALAIPLTLVAIHFAIATVTGSSVNPARSIGSALVGGDLTGLWIYLVGPVVGGVLGWAVYRGTNNPADPDDLAEVVDTRG